MAVAEAEVGSAGMVADKSPIQIAVTGVAVVNNTHASGGVQGVDSRPHAYLNAEGVAPHIGPFGSISVDDFAHEHRVAKAIRDFAYAERVYVDERTIIIGFTLGAAGRRWPDAAHDSRVAGGRSLLDEGKFIQCDSRLGLVGRAYEYRRPFFERTGHPVRVPVRRSRRPYGCFFRHQGRRKATGVRVVAGSWRTC